MSGIDHPLPEQLLSAREVAALLGIGLSTFYRIAYFKTRKVRVEGTVRYPASDVARYQHVCKDAA